MVAQRGDSTATCALAGASDGARERARARARVWPHPGIEALELWDVVVGDRTLFERRDEPTFFDSLAAAVAALRRGEASRAGGARLPAVPWESVVLMGGGVDVARARASFASADLRLEYASSEPCLAVTMARAALSTEAAPHAGRYDASGEEVVVADVGQTAIKVAGRAGTFHCPRARGVDAREPARETFAADIAAAAALAMGGRAPAQLVLALPCEVRSAGHAVVLGASTYPTEGDGAELADEVARHLLDGERPAPPAALGAAAAPAVLDVVMVNDAVLAAWAFARGPASVAPSRGELVLTVGLGVGAAFIREERAPGQP